MKRIYITLLLICFATLGSWAQTRTELLSGVVTNAVDRTPIQNAIVTIKGTFLETETNAMGQFSIPVFPKDELIITAFSMNATTIAVPENKTNVSIPLTYNAELLEAVSIREKQEQEAYLETQFGKKSSNRVGYSYDELREQFISNADIDLYTVARKIPFIYVEGDPFSGQVVYNSRMRGALGSSRVPMQIIVDGIPVEQNVLATINPQLVTNISITRSLAGTVQYGSLGAGGVMRITTTNSAKRSRSSRKPTSLLVRGNNYDEGILPISEDIEMATAPYLDALQPYSDRAEAKRVYEEQRQLPETRNLAYYIDMAEFFSKWGPTFRYDILSDLYEQAPDNPRILKTIAFILEENGHDQQAAFVLERLLDLRPGDIQNYRDVARLYARTGRYNTAATLYKQMIYNTVPNVDFEPILPIIFNEFRHLIANHKRHIDFKNLPNEFLSVNFNKDVRIVLEYTNPLSEFEIQFVSPSKKYYTWRHTAFDAKELLEEEIAKGHAVKEFVIEESDYGNWLMNVTSLNSTPGTNPTFLKYTIYKNYGTPNETREVKVLNLAQHTKKVTLDSFFY
ncbi:MAG: TonB-dependent receptor plug domain-containing protein [Marinirhabdus sp.]|nr:TonB-dependent receptor plug domain-containing protein [Marinirhabdus sp.]